MDRNTELRRLAQVLHKKIADLDYLSALDASALMALRRAFQNHLLQEFGKTFELLAAGGKISPDALSALLCKKVFGPALTANMSYYTPSDRAARMCKHFDAEFMAEVAREQIPERAERLLKELPIDLMRAVTRALIASKDYHVMGGFTDYLPEDTALALMTEVKSPADNLRISSFAQRKDRIARLSARMPDEQVKGFIAAAFTSPELIQEVGLVTAEMPADQQKRMAKLTDAVDPKYREQSRAIAEKAGLLEKMQPFFAA
jgi:hypothetical protein